MGPSVGDDGVPMFALLLAPPGESVYRCFVILGRIGKASRFITVVGEDSRATDCIDWLGTNDPSAAIDPLPAQMKAGPPPPQDPQTLRPSPPRTHTPRLIPQRDSYFPFFLAFFLSFFLARTSRALVYMDINLLFRAIDPPSQSLVGDVGYGRGAQDNFTLWRVFATDEKCLLSTDGDI